MQWIKNVEGISVETGIKAPGGKRKNKKISKLLKQFDWDEIEAMLN